MSSIKMPRWAPLFFLIEGALSALSLDGAVGKCSRLTFLAFMIGLVWFTSNRHRFVQPE